jgi:predicted DNA-binding transcriptional regulator AlpA
MDIKIKNIIKKINSENKTWFNTKEFSELTCLGPRSFSWLSNIRKKKVKNNVMIHKDSVIDTVIKNESAILGWPKREDISKELGVRCQTIGYNCSAHGIRQKIDISRKERIHPEDLDKLKQVLSKNRSQMPSRISIDGVCYYSLVRTVNDYMLNIKCDNDEERESIFNRKYKTFYKWIVQEENNDLTYKRIGNNPQVFIRQKFYDILSDSITAREAEKILGVSFRTIYNWINKGYLSKYKISNSTGILRRSEVLACKRLPRIFSHIKAKGLDMFWNTKDDGDMWNGSICYSQDGGIMADVIVYFDDKPILSMSCGDFRGLFRERMRNNPYGINYDGEVVMYPQLFLSTIFSNEIKYTLI